MTEKTTWCVGFMIEVPGNTESDAIDRIIDGLCEAAEKEGAFLGGGAHPVGTNPMCWDCRTDNTEEGCDLDDVYDQHTEHCKLHK